MHAHDCEVSPCAVIKAKELVDGYKEAGYDGIVITNHFDKGIMHLWGETTEEHYQTYLRGYELAKEEGERVGLRVILGMEIRLECGPEDYLVYGVTRILSGSIWTSVAAICRNYMRSVRKMDVS